VSGFKNNYSKYFSCDTSLRDAKRKISYWPTLEPIFSVTNRKTQNARHTLIAYQVLKELKISQFADDTSLICSNLISVQNGLLILNEFGILSGLKLNESTTKAIWLGPWKQHTERPLNFIWMKKPLKILVIYISYDKMGNERKMSTKKLKT